MRRLFIFTRLYGRYIDDILYKERQQQMKEVTVQLFKRLDDVTQRWWKDTDVFCGTIEDHAFASLDELYAYLQSLSQLYNVDAEQRHLVAVDESGSYLTHDGWNGTLSEMAFLLDSPERVSFVTSRVGRTDVGIFFLQKLPEPVTVRDGGETVRLTYFGLSCRLAELNPFSPARRMTITTAYMFWIPTVDASSAAATTRCWAITPMPR